MDLITDKCEIPVLVNFCCKNSSKLDSDTFVFHFNTKDGLTVVLEIPILLWVCQKEGNVVNTKQFDRAICQIFFE